MSDIKKSEECKVVPADKANKKPSSPSLPCRARHCFHKGCQPRETFFCVYCDEDHGARDKLKSHLQLHCRFCAKLSYNKDDAAEHQAGCDNFIYSGELDGE